MRNSLSMRMPTLSDVLTNQAPPPYTLSAFMAFLSQNHCLETLEFTLDASRYQSYYYSLDQIPPRPGSEEASRLKNSWDRLINAYIRPGSVREVNLAAAERDSLLRIPNTYTPPSPEALDSAVYKITELMRESVLSPFLQACQQQLANAATYQQPFGLNQQIDHQGDPMHFSRAMSVNHANAALSYHNNQNQMVFGQGSMYAHQQPAVQPSFIGQQSFTNNPSGVSQLLHGRIPRATSARPTSVPSSDLLGVHDPWNSNNNNTNTNDDSDMLGSEDPITPPHTPPTNMSMSPMTGGGQWKSKIKSQFSKMNSSRSKARE